MGKGVGHLNFLLFMAFESLESGPDGDNIIDSEENPPCTKCHHPYPFSNSCDQYLSEAHCGPMPTTGIRLRAIHTAWSLERGSRRTEDSRHGLRKVVTRDGKCMWQNYHPGWLQPSKKPSSKNGKYVDDKRFWFQIFLLLKPINLSGGLFSSDE